MTLKLLMTIHRLQLSSLISREGVVMRMNRFSMVMLGFLLATGCSSPGDSTDHPSKEEVRLGKADGVDMCNKFDLPPGCDLCEEFGWYGDGECDQDLIDSGICRRTDSDCRDGESDGGIDGGNEDGGAGDGVGGDVGGDEGQEAACKEPVPLPERIEFVGEPSAVAVDDLDGDGCLDIALIEADAQWITLVIAWGDPEGTWSDRWTHRIRENNSVMPMWWTRDTSSQVIALGNWDGDGALDVATSTGIALNTGARNLEWHPLPGEGAEPLFPVALVDLEGNGTTWLVRTTTSGCLERCSAVDACQHFGGDPTPGGNLNDMVVGDFDHDGRPDIVAGDSRDNPRVSWLWRSGSDWHEPVSLGEMHCVDYEVGDVDDDGFPDIVAQQKEFISDFPTYTDVWISKADGFEKLQTLYNYDNHNDAAALVDIDGDGCIDYLQIGVDRGVGLRWGNCTRLEEHGPRAWIDVVERAGTGVQCLDITGDDQCELIIRNALIDAGQHQQGFLYFHPCPSHE